VYIWMYGVLRRAWLSASLSACATGGRGVLSAVCCLLGLVFMSVVAVIWYWLGWD